MLRKFRLPSSILWTLLGAVLGGGVVYLVVEERFTDARSIANREYKAAMSNLSTRALSRIRTGDLDDAARLLEDHLDSFLVGVPMGEDYPQMTQRCQHALAVAKIYRSRFPFPDECKHHGHDLHHEHLPAMLDRVPLLPADHPWLDESVRKVRKMPHPATQSAAGEITVARNSYYSGRRL